MNIDKNAQLSIAFDLNHAKMNEYLTYIQKHQIKQLNNIASNKIVIHHIIPSCWFKQHKLTIDNSENNTVYLLHKDHCIVHILLAQYYIEKDNDSELKMTLGMCNAVNRMLKKNSSTYPQINTLSSDEMEFIANNYQNIMIKYREKWSNLIRITNGKEDKLINKYEVIPDGWWRGRSFAGKRICITNGIVTKHINKDDEIPDGWYYGSHMTICKNTIWINDGKHNKRILNTDDIPNGYVKGQLVAHRHISDNFKYSSKNKILISNGIESRFIQKTEILPEGWHYGGKIENHGRTPHNLNKIWITNGVKNKYVNKNENIPDGWYLGLTVKKNKPRPKKRWITNGIQTLQINHDDVLPTGFYYGRSDIHCK